MPGAATQVRFPAVSFAAQVDFLAWCAASRPLLDGRYLHERSLAVPPGRHSRPGTCAPCLRRTLFEISADHAEKLPDGSVPDGRIVPNWREQLLCDCEDRLSNRHRAVLHFVESALALSSWERVLAFGRLSETDSRLYRRLGATALVPRLAPQRDGPPRLNLADASCHLALSLDGMHRVPPLGTLLAEFRRVLAPGGALVFTVPFRWDRPATRSLPVTASGGAAQVESAREVHEIGWDILERLRGAGFARSRAHVYWSEELGYLGPFNTLFSAET